LVATKKPQRSIIQTEGLSMYIQCCLQYLLAGYYLRRGRQQQRARKRTRSRKVSTMRLLYSVPSIALCKVSPDCTERKKSRRCRWLASMDRRKVLNVNGWEKNKQKKVLSQATRTAHTDSLVRSLAYSLTFYSAARK
jgi:hypothetical protein